MSLLGGHLASDAHPDLSHLGGSTTGNDSYGVEGDTKFNDTDPCWGTLRRVDVYRIYLVSDPVLSETLPSELGGKGPDFGCLSSRGLEAPLCPEPRHKNMWLWGIPCHPLPHRPGRKMNFSLTPVLSQGGT